MTELRLALTLAAMLTLPGWAILALGDSWRHWARLQRWCVAVGISIAIYPVLFYGLRAVLPFAALGPYTIGTLLALCAGVVLLRMRRDWRDQLAFDRLEWSAIAIFGMTLFTRYWIIRDHPYPAWSDSLHHTLLTLLTATRGQLPTNLEPYAPVPLDMYHLGLYALSACTQWLAQVQAHTALLWTAQALNALCCLGVYLVLDRKVGRFAGVAGAAVAGLLCHQPAYYVNWGRFTQVSAQSILLIAWVITWEAIAMWRRFPSPDAAQSLIAGQNPKRKPSTIRADPSPDLAQRLVCTFLAGLLTGAVFLLHFRVAGFYLPLLAISLGWEFWHAWREHKIGRVLAGTILIGACALVLILPALWPSLRVYAAGSMRQARIPSGEAAPAHKDYYAFHWSLVPDLAAHDWLLCLAVLSAVLGVLRRNKIVLAAILWLLLLALEGNAYLLKLPLIGFTDVGSMLILGYLPISLIIGGASHELPSMIRREHRQQAVAVFAAMLLVLAFLFIPARVSAIDPARYFVTETDVGAMSWIKANTPPDATFAINTMFWLPRAANGTDAGYWIPYFTGRSTTASSMMYTLASGEYENRIFRMSVAAMCLARDNAELENLRKLGVDFIYIGRRGNFAGNKLDPGRLRQAPGVTAVYQHDGVFIFAIK